MSLRLGLAGLGTHGQRYADHLLRGDVSGAELTAVSRADETLGRRFASEHGVAFVHDPRELAGHPDVDAVVLCLPPDLHPAAAEACLARNRPVLVEKPMAPDVAAARRLTDLSRRSGSFLMVGQTLRYDAVVLALKEACPTIGAIRSVYINQRFEPSTHSWIDVPGSGGLLLNTGIHGFDLLRFLTGCEPIHVWAEVERHLTRRTEDQFVASVRLGPGPILAVVDNSRASSSRSGRIEIVGEAGQLWADHVHRTLHRVRDRQAEDLGPIPIRHTLPITLGEFVKAVLNDAPPPITATDGLRAVELVEAARSSADTGRRVTLEEIR